MLLIWGCLLIVLFVYILTTGKVRVPTYMSCQNPASTSLGILVGAAFDFHNETEAAEAEAAKAKAAAEAEAAKTEPAKANPDAEAAKARCAEATRNKKVLVKLCASQRKRVRKKKQRGVGSPISKKTLN